MSNILTDERARLASELEAAIGMTVHNHLPERMVTPAVFLAPADPYVTRGIPGSDEAVPWGKVRVNHEVIVVAGKGTNKVTIEKLDEMVADIVVAMSAELGDVGQPGQINLSNGTYLAVAIRLTSLISL